MQEKKWGSTMKRIPLIVVVWVAACLEQRALEQFNTTVTRLCVSANPAATVDQHLSTHPQGCMIVPLEKRLAAGLNEVGLQAGVYRTQATNLGFTHYLDEVILARAADMLVVMTPGAFHELAQAAAAVHEARLEEEQLREGLGLVIWGSLQAFAPAAPRPLTQDQLGLVRTGLGAGTHRQK